VAQANQQATASTNQAPRQRDTSSASSSVTRAMAKPTKRKGAAERAERSASSCSRASAPREPARAGGSGLSPAPDTTTKLARPEASVAMAGRIGAGPA